MPVNDIVERLSASLGATPIESDAAPELNAPAGKPAPTSMRTGVMMPPYLHYEEYGDDSALSLILTALGLVGVVTGASEVL
jgi:hypothetical protein